MTARPGSLRDLDAARWRVARSLTAAMVLLYFGFILLVAYGRALLAIQVVPGLTLGILQIVKAVLLMSGALDPGGNMAAGTVLTLVLIYLSPTLQVDLLGNNSAWFPLRNPAIITMPLSFLAGIAVSLLAPERSAAAGYAAWSGGCISVEGTSMSPLSSRARARDLARDWVERGGQGPSVAALLRDDITLGNVPGASRCPVRVYP